MKGVLLLSLFLAVAYGQREPGSIWIPSPHYGSRGGNTAKWLIVHGTAGGSSAEAIGEWFQNPASQAATHYVIGQDGTVVQCVDESQSAWGNGRVETGADSWWGTPNPNSVTISIEHVKPKTDNSDLITPAQATASFRLIKNIIARHPGIRMAWGNSAGGITGHFSMSPQSRERCPGPYPWEELFTELTGSSPPMCMVTITADTLNVRAEPTSASAVVGTVPHYRVVNVRAKVQGQDVNGNPNWYQLHDSSGYISAYYTSKHISQPSWC